VLVNKIINYNNFKYIDLINFYKLCFINQSEIFKFKSFKLFIIEGYYDRGAVEHFFKIRESNFKLFSKYRRDEIFAAIDFFTSLDYDNVVNRKWY